MEIIEQLKEYIDTKKTEDNSMYIFIIENKIREIERLIEKL